MLLIATNIKFIHLIIPKLFPGYHDLHQHEILRIVKKILISQFLQLVKKKVFKNLISNSFLFTKISSLPEFRKNGLSFTYKMRLKGTYT